jgi:SnoaL-like domain
MSQENVERALELIEAFNRRDLDAFMALTHVQIDVESQRVAMERGHKGVRRGWESFLGAFGNHNLEVEELRDLGDVTLAQMRGWGRGADSVTLLVDFVWIPMRWRDGKLIWWRSYPTEADALVAVELSE